MADKHANLLRIDPYTETGVTIYYGYAKAGTTDTSGEWSLKKVIDDGGIKKIQYPLVDNRTILGYVFSWSGRTTYTYQ